MKNNWIFSKNEKDKGMLQNVEFSKPHTFKILILFGEKDLRIRYPRYFRHRHASVQEAGLEQLQEP